MRQIFLVCHNLTVSVNSFTIVKSVLGQSLRQQKTRPLEHYIVHGVKIVIVGKATCRRWLSFIISAYFLLLLLRPPPVSLFNRGIKTTCCLALCDRSLLFPLRKSNLLRKVVMRSGLSWTGSGKKRLETVQGSETSHTCC